MIVSWQIMCWSPNPQWMEFRDWTFGGWLGLDEVIRERLHDGIRAHTKQRKQGSPGGSEGKESACNAGARVRALGQEDTLQNGMAAHCSIFTWRIRWAEKPGRLQSRGHKDLDTTEQLMRAL